MIAFLIWKRSIIVFLISVWYHRIINFINTISNWVRCSLFNSHRLLTVLSFASDRIRKLIIRDSVKHGCHVPQPLVLLTPQLVELDIDHFYLMQILSIVSEQTQSNCLKIFAQLRRLTVRQFDERLTKSFFASFPQIKLLTLVFTPYKMQIYRAKLPFLDELLLSIPNLISLKFAHVKKPQDYLAYLDLQSATKQRMTEYYTPKAFWCRWYDDHTQRYHQYATFLCSI